MVAEHSKETLGWRCKFVRERYLGMSARGLETALGLINRDQSHVSIRRYEQDERPVPADYLTGLYVLAWARKDVRINPAWLLLGHEPIEELDPTTAEEFMRNVATMLEQAKLHAPLELPDEVEPAHAPTAVADSPTLPELDRARKALRDARLSGDTHKPGAGKDQTDKGAAGGHSA